MECIRSQSPREITRNNAIYATQNNRNPYIDHPEYAKNLESYCRHKHQLPTNLIATGTSQTTTNLSWTAAKIM
jgi:hypothetical protein